MHRCSDAGASYTAKSQLQNRPSNFVKLKSIFFPLFQRIAAIFLEQQCHIRVVGPNLEIPFSAQAVLCKYLSVQIVVCSAEKLFFQRKNYSLLRSKPILISNLSNLMPVPFQNSSTVYQGNSLLCKQLKPFLSQQSKLFFLCDNKVIAQKFIFFVNCRHFNTDHFS